MANSVIVNDLINVIPELTPAVTVVGTLSVDGYSASDLTYKITYQTVTTSGWGSESAAQMFAIVGNSIFTTTEARYDPPYDDHRRFYYSLSIDAMDAAGNYVGTASLTFSVSDVMDEINGTARTDKLVGDYGMNYLIGGAGNDKLYGLRGNDILHGGSGKDVLSGGQGSDTFLFKSIKESTVKTADVITTWDHTTGKFPIRDTIDLFAIDANTRVSGDQDFKWIGAKNFTGKAGQLRYEKEGSHTFVYADVNGDKKADFAIDLVGSHKMYADDFLL